MSISVSIAVDKENCKIFEDYLLKEQDEILSSKTIMLFFSLYQI